MNARVGVRQMRVTIFEQQGSTVRQDPSSRPRRGRDEAMLAQLTLKCRQSRMYPLSSLVFVRVLAL